jgi:DNA-binding PadR family transcriptional regulator
MGPSPTEFAILVLFNDRPGYGQELVARSGGEITRGTIYVTLGRMATKGFIASHTESRVAGDGGLPRRIYTITDSGRQMLELAAKMQRVMARD